MLATDDQAKPRRETVQERQAARWIEAEQPLHDLSVLPETMDQVARYTEADEPLPDLPALPENVDMDNLASGQPADDCFAQVVQDSFVHPDDMDSLPPAQTEEESSARPDKDSARSNRPAVLRTLQKLATLQSQHFPSSTLFDVLFTRSGKAAVELSSALKAMLECKDLVLLTTRLYSRFQNSIAFIEILTCLFIRCSRGKRSCLTLIISMNNLRSVFEFLTQGCGTLAL